MNIYLCGLIGSGKTSIGMEIAKRLHRPFHDVDQIMEKEAGRRIHDVVAEEGWVSYREREYSICKRLARMDPIVGAFAGGTVRYEWNRDVLKGRGVIILLTARLDTLVRRAIRNDRPRVNPVSTLKEDLALLWKEKKHLYYRSADFVYRTDQGKTIRQEASDIIRNLKEKGFLGR